MDTKNLLCHPVRIFPRAWDSCNDNCKDPSGMTLFRLLFVIFVHPLRTLWLSF